MKSIALAALVTASLAITPAWAHEGHNDARGKAVVNSVDAPAHKVNLSHEAIPALSWPAMKMDFAVAPSIDLSAVKPGAKVEFTIEKNKAGTFEIQSLKPMAN